MKRFDSVMKVEGETPLQALERYRTDAGIPPGVPIAYAGRLDPMASGKLLLLVGEECKRQTKYHSLDKAYEFEVLLDAESDTGDILGMPEVVPSTGQLNVHELTETALAFCGSVTLPYPRYSSKTVKGKPLFLWTLENRLAEIDIPVATTRIYGIKYLDSRTIRGADLLDSIHSRIARVGTVTEPSKMLGADFRRADILASWDESLREPEREFTIARFSVVCSSGTYIRSLAPALAARLGKKGLAYSIRRTKIGRFFPFPFTHNGIWWRTY